MGLFSHTFSFLMVVPSFIMHTFFWRVIFG